MALKDSVHVGANTVVIELPTASGSDMALLTKSALTVLINGIATVFPFEGGGKAFKVGPGRKSATGKRIGRPPKAAGAKVAKKAARKSSSTRSKAMKAAWAARKAAAAGSAPTKKVAKKVSKRLAKKPKLASSTASE